MSADTESEVPDIPIIEYTDETVQTLIANIKTGELGEPKKSN